MCTDLASARRAQVTDNKAPSMLGNEISCLLLSHTQSAFFPRGSRKTRESEQEDREAATKEGEIRERLASGNNGGTGTSSRSNMVGIKS